MLTISETFDGLKLEDVIAQSVARLREAEPKEDVENREAGRLVGAEWAGTATKRQLRRLADHVGCSDGRNANTGDATDYVEVANNGLNDGHAFMLMKALDPKTEFLCSEFWETILGEDEGDWIEDQAFAIGFIEGALTVWEVKNS